MRKGSCVSLISCACQILMWLSMYQNMHIHNELEFDTRLDLKYSAEATVIEDLWRIFLVYYVLQALQIYFG